MGDDELAETDTFDEAETFADEMAKMRRKMARIWGGLTLRKMRDLRRRWPRPRRSRLPAEARALRSVVRKAPVAGLVPMPERGRGAPRATGVPGDGRAPTVGKAGPGKAGAPGAANPIPAANRRILPQSGDCPLALAGCRVYGTCLPPEDLFAYA